MSVASRVLRIPLISAVALVAACSSGEDKLDLSTGWLGSLSEYQRATGEGAEGTFVRPTVDPAAPLEGAFLLPVEVTVDPRSDFSAISPREFDELRTVVASALRAATREVVTLRAGPGPQTYNLRIALTNLRLNLVDDRALRPGREDFRFGFAGAAIEAELREGGTNFRRAILIARPAGNASPGATGWSGVPDRLEALADAFRRELAAAKEAIAKLKSLPPPQSPEDDRKDESKEEKK